MRINQIILGVFLLGFSFLSSAQTADEVVSKYLETIGGKDAWSKITSLKSTAKVSAQGMEFPTTIYAKPNKSKIEFTFQGMSMVQPAFDGTTGWQTNFMTMKAEKMETEDSEMLKDEFGDFPDPFLNYKAKGYVVAIDGTETVDGVECIKLKLTKKPVKIDGVEVENSTTYFFDKENFVPIITRSTIKKGEGKGQISEAAFSDYQEVDGLMMPFSLEQRFDGKAMATIVISKIETNVAIDDKIFEFPVE